MKELWNKLQQLLPQLKMRLRASVRRRLALDIMALSTGVRAAVMLDYMPSTPAMLQQLCQLLFHISQEVHEIAALRVLHMEGCGYLIQPSYLLEYMNRSLRLPSPLLFIVLDDDIPRKASQTEQEAIVKNLSEIQRQISSLLSVQSMKSCSGSQASNGESLSEVTEGAVPNVLAAGDPTNGSGILLPTLNGWLLGYPVVYFFLEENASRAGRCVASGAVQLYQVLISSTVLNPSNFHKDAELICDEDELLRSPNLFKEHPMFGSLFEWKSLHEKWNLLCCKDHWLHKFDFQYHFAVSLEYHIPELFRCARRVFNESL
ncbi:hypothetical protein KC19_10G158600 [Ceratodon purpureus]|uniref:Uncharacterized protein n=1 Tax=Ceratodon purpureus TaxID=3225 RepID=A0A8T0GMG0_CERPU|nr:hypothetical protein KC19_10G158600 [Ceratodon purpureus]